MLTGGTRHLFVHSTMTIKLSILFYPIQFYGEYETWELKQNYAAKWMWCYFKFPKVTWNKISNRQVAWNQLPQYISWVHSWDLRRTGTSYFHRKSPDKEGSVRPCTSNIYLAHKQIKISKPSSSKHLENGSNQDNYSCLWTAESVLTVWCSYMFFFNPIVI